MEYVASSSFPYRHQPLCLLYFPFALAREIMLFIEKNQKKDQYYFPAA